MEIRFDWPVVYASVLGRCGGREKVAHSAARRIRREIALREYQPGFLLGTAPELCERYGLGRETLIETCRLLDDWQVARMRRGPQGGLIVLPSPRWNAALAIAAYFRTWGISSVQIAEASQTLALIQEYCFAAESQRPESFDTRFQYCLARGGSPVAMACIDTTVRYNRALHPFIEALEFLHDSEAGSFLLNRPSGESSLANLVAGHLLQLVRQCRARHISHIGFEAELTERMGVSRQVMRQAIRLLEDRGHLICQRGRGRGISTVPGHPATVVERLAEHYEQLQLAETEFRPALYALTRFNRLLVAAKSDASAFDRIIDLAYGQRWNDPSARLGRFHLEWQLLDNPVLSLLEQTLAAYRCQRAETAGTFTFVGEIDLGRLQTQVREQMEALKVRNFGLADHINVQLHRTVKMTLGGY